MPKVKPLIKVDRKKFIDWILDEENGSSLGDIAKMIKKKRIISAADLMMRAGYIPSEFIKNRKDVPKELKDNVSGRDFEVYPTDFIVELVG